jgi:hypothetical protein
MTGDTPDSSDPASAKSRACHCFRKPFSVSRLAETIAALAKCGEIERNSV